MLKNIKSKYPVTHYLDTEDINKADFLNDYEFDCVYPLLKKMGGNILQNGLFQIYSFKKAFHWTKLITRDYFPEFKDSLFCFAVNWQGCVLAVNQDNNTIYLFDPATCEYFAVEDVTLDEFFETIFLENKDEIIFPEDFINSMSYLKRDVLDSEFSIGHKVSLFLGGEDEFDNLEVVNTEVMWDLQIQVAEGINEITE